VNCEGEDGRRINFPLEPDNAGADRQLALGASSFLVHANDQVFDVRLVAVEFLDRADGIAEFEPGQARNCYGQGCPAMENMS